MPLSQLDVIVRVAGATLLLVALVAFRPPLGRVQAGRAQAARACFVPLAVCLCSFLAGNSPDPGLQLGGPLGTLAVVLAGYAAVFLWWFCLAVFDAGFRPRGPVLAAGAAWLVIASADRGLFGERLAQAGLSWALVALGLAMVGHLAWRLLADREGDLVDGRRRARRLVVVLLGGQLLADLAVDLFLGLEWRPQAFAIAQNVALLAFTAWLLGLTRGAAEVPTAGAEVPMADPLDDPGASPDAVSPLAARLRRLMEVERVHLDPGLTFGGFVRALGAPEKAVRRLINRELGHDHFRSFLNSYRVAEARAILADPARRGDKLAAVAFDSGFASLPSFNRVFREVEGRTPSAYRAAALAGALTGAQAVF